MCEKGVKSPSLPIFFLQWSGIKLYAIFIILHFNQDFLQISKVELFYLIVCVCFQTFIHILTQLVVRLMDTIWYLLKKRNEMGGQSVQRWPGYLLSKCYICETCGLNSSSLTTYHFSNTFKVIFECLDLGVKTFATFHIIDVIYWNGTHFGGIERKITLRSRTSHLEKC